MRTIDRSALTVGLLMTALLGWHLGSTRAVAGADVGPHLVAFDMDPQQQRMVRWAAGRFESAGLHVPEIDVYFHDDGEAACRGFGGFAKDSRIDFCVRGVDARAHRLLLHEIGHLWLDENLEASDRRRFLAFRGVSTWNSWDEPWRHRGYEHAAEVLAWALGDRVITPAISGLGTAGLERAYRLLTGEETP